nr:hypothetical protein BgiMline_015662 [Biomphalaria glabrata]
MIEPVGCNETTMWPTSCKSKLSCARLCEDNESCATFFYSRESQTCFICPRDVIRNLNFYSDKVYSWPFQMDRRSFLHTKDNDTLTFRLRSVQVEINLGSLIHVSGFLLEDPVLIIELCLEDNCTNKPFVFSVHGPPYENPRLRLNYRLNNSPEHYVYFDLNDNQFVGNSDTSVDILVTEDGYQVFIDQLFVCSFDHVLPCDGSRYLYIRGILEVYQLRL